MTTLQHMERVQEIADHLLGREGMSKYPSLLLVGLLLISFSIRKYRSKLPVFD